MDNGITVHADKLQDAYYVLALEVILPEKNEFPSDHYIRVLKHRTKVDEAYIAWMNAVFEAVTK